jgi:hypothetical protein
MTDEERQELKQLLERLREKYKAEWHYQMIIPVVREPGHEDWKVSQDWSSGFIEAQDHLARMARPRKKES